jgi:hypothetical protein
MNTFRFSILWCCFLSFVGWSQGDLAPKYSNEFLSLGVGADAFSMGNAVVASTEGVNASYWNPAGLIQQSTKMEASLMHSEYFAGIAKYDYGALAFRFDSSSAGAISLIRFGVDDIPNTLQLIDANGNVNYDNISKFNATDFAAIISYSKRIPKLKGIDIGGSVKIVRRKIGDFANSWGFGIDAGLNYKLAKNWKFSLVGRDITGTFNAWSYTLDENTKKVFAITNNEIPKNNIEVTVPRLISGISNSKKLWKEKIQLITELDFITTFDGKRNTLIKNNIFSIDPSIGIELGYIQMIFLRFGINNYQTYTDTFNRTIRTIQPNFGVGIKYKSVALNYAFTNLANVSIAPYSHIFSLNLDLNKTR